MTSIGSIFASIRQSNDKVESQLVAYHVPVIAVQKGNPKNITSLKDFTKPDLKVALGDANATAIGKAGSKQQEHLLSKVLFRRS